MINYITRFQSSIKNRDSWLVSMLLCLIVTFSFTTQDSILAIGLIGLVAYVLKPHFKKHALNNYVITKYCLFSLVWLMLVFILSNVGFMALNGMVILSTIPLMFLIATHADRFEITWQHLTVFFVLLAGVFSVWGLYQVGHQVGKGLTEGPYNDRNTFASLINILWFLLAWKYFTLKEYSAQQSLIKWALNNGLVILVFFLASTVLFVSSSRGAMIAWLLFSPIMFWASYTYTKSKSKLFIALLMVVTAYLVSGFLFDSNLSDRTFALSKDQSSIARLQLWISTFYMAIDHPLFGVGWDNFQFYYPQYRYVQENSTTGMYTHNDYLQLAAEGGVIALALIAGLFLFVLNRLKNILLAFYKAISNRLDVRMRETTMASHHAYESIALLLGVSAVMLHAGVNFIFYYSGVNILLALYLGRVVTLSEVPAALLLPKFAEIRPSIKSLIWKFIGVILFLPFFIHALLQLSFTGDKPLLKLLKSSGLNISGFDLASATVNIYPHNYYAQEFIMLSYEEILTSPEMTKKQDTTRKVLALAIEDFDKFRRYNANWASIGSREVRLILSHLNLDNQQGVLRNKAYQILKENLSSNVFHSESYVLRARLEKMQGLDEKAEATIDDAAKHMLSMHDLILVNLQYMLQHKKLTPDDLKEFYLIEEDMLRVRNLAERGHIDADVEERFGRGNKLLEKLYARPDL